MINRFSSLRGTLVFLPLVLGLLCRHHVAAEDPSRDSDREIAMTADAAEETGGMEQAAREEEAEQHGPPIHGVLSSRYRARWTDESRDQDVDAGLALDLGEADRHWITAHFDLQGWWDADGNRKNNGFYAFDDLWDTYDDNPRVRVYLAHLDLHRVRWMETIRFGRQSIYETPVFAYFDGLRLESGEFGAVQARFGAYGGLSVHHYEDYDGRDAPEGDYTYGAFGECRPWLGGRIRGEWMHVQDELLSRTDEDDLLAVSLWQQLFETLNLHGRYTVLEGESRDVTTSVHYYHPGWDLQVDGSYYGLLSTQKESSQEFDPFYATLLDYHPYHQIRLLLAKGIGEHFMLEGGAEARRLMDNGDLGDFNREFDHYHIRPSTVDFPLRGMFLSCTGEMWVNSGNDILSFGADATQKFASGFHVSVGSYYSLYKYDYFDDRERDEIQTYYAKLKYLWQSMRFSIDYEFEDDDFENYQTLKTSLSWDF